MFNLQDQNAAAGKGPNHRLRIRFQRLLVIVVGWGFIGVLITVYDHFGLYSGLSAGPSNDYSFLNSLAFNIGAATIGGLLGGAWLVFYVNERLRDKPYAYTLLAVGASFIAVVSFIMLFLGTVLVWQFTGHLPFTDEQATELFRANLTDALHLKNVTVWSCVVLLTQFLLQVNDKFGPGLAFDLMRGKYQVPRREDRVFMFVDLTGSTGIAERLGDDRYHALLRDLFGDMTNSIVDNGGRIYQYVGDEVVVSWKTQDALAGHRCLSCFLDIQRSLKALDATYQSKYALSPVFKAAAHHGQVVAGEIGIIKRDITYSGDVLNTTARILSMCNQVGRDLLISEPLREALVGAGGPYGFDAIGAADLRGKTEQVKIFAVRETA